MVAELKERMDEKVGRGRPRKQFTYHVIEDVGAEI